jgi:hypothetical protein
MSTGYRATIAVYSVLAFSSLPLAFAFSLPDFILPLPRSTAAFVSFPFASYFKALI